MADLSAGEALPNSASGGRNPASENRNPAVNGQGPGAEGRQAFNAALSGGRADAAPATGGAAATPASAGTPTAPGATGTPTTPAPTSGSAAPSAGTASTATAPSIEIGNTPPARGPSEPPQPGRGQNPAISDHAGNRPIADNPSGRPLASPATAPDSPEAGTRVDGRERQEVAARQTGAASQSAVGKDPDVLRFDLPVLQLGSSDRAVGLLQRALMLLGYLTKHTDGRFCAETDLAVRSFQEGRGLTRDGVVGNRETWPALNTSLVNRHEGITRLSDAMVAGRALTEPRIAELRQLNGLLVEFGNRSTAMLALKEGTVASAAVREIAYPAMSSSLLFAADQQSGSAFTYVVRGGETLADIARSFSLPVSALIAANPELTRPYLILQGQLLLIPNPDREKPFRRVPKQLHPADPDGYLADARMNPIFVDLVNGMIAGLRGEGFDVRLIAGFRSLKEQQRRFEQGRLSPGSILTDAEAGHSWHNYGLAVDIVLNDEEGRAAWPEDSGLFWQRLGDMALAHGAVWGGGFGYPAHVEYHPAFERCETGSLIDDFESYGLEAVWAQIELVPEDAQDQD